MKNDRKLIKLFGFKGACNARGITVIIDVFRAGALAAYLVNQSIKMIIPVRTIAEAFTRKSEIKDCLLFGEQKGHRIKGFDYGNSPHEIAGLNFNGRTAIHRTEMGTNGIALAVNASEVIYGGFPAASAITDYIDRSTSDICSFVAMDGAGSEDDICADYLISRLEGKSIFSTNRLRTLLKDHYGARRFLDPEQPEFPEEDFYLCTEINKFPFFPLKIADYFVKR